MNQLEIKWYGYVYKTINLLNGKIYIGQKIGSFNPDYHGSGTYIKYALKHYGSENFNTIVLSYASDKKELDILEIKHIQAYRNSLPKEMIYNIAVGGSAPMVGRKHTDETKKKMGLSHLGINNPMYGKDMTGKNNPHYGKHLTEEQKKNLSYKNSLHKGKDHGNYGKIRSTETRLKISNSKKGHSVNTGHKASEETKRKISISASKRIGEKNSFFGKHHTEETKQKIRETKKRRLLQLR